MTVVVLNRGDGAPEAEDEAVVDAVMLLNESALEELRKIRFALEVLIGHEVEDPA